MTTTFFPQPPWGLRGKDTETGLPIEVVEAIEGEGNQPSIWTHYETVEKEGVLGYMLYQVTVPLAVEPRRFVPLRLRRFQ